MTQAAEAEPQFTPAKKGDFAVAVQHPDVCQRQTLLLVRVHSADKDGNIKLLTGAASYGRTGARTRGTRRVHRHLPDQLEAGAQEHTWPATCAGLQGQQEGDEVPVLAWNSLFEATEDVTAVINKGGEATRTIPYTEPEVTQAEDSSTGPNENRPPVKPAPLEPHRPTLTPATLRSTEPEDQPGNGLFSRFPGGTGGRGRTTRPP